MILEQTPETSRISNNEQCPNISITNEPLTQTLRELKIEIVCESKNVRMWFQFVNLFPGIKYPYRDSSRVLRCHFCTVAAVR